MLRAYPTKNYLLNVTFYAGSDEPNDTDTGTFLLKSNKAITESEMKDIFRKVNDLLTPFEERNFPISYEQGLNLETLIEGVGIYTKETLIKDDTCIKNTIEPINSNHGPIKIDNYYVIEQWQ